MPSQQTEPDSHNLQIAAEKCQLVRDWLQGSDLKIEQSEDTLSQTIELVIEDTTEEADKILADAGDLWATLATKIKDMEQVHTTLLKGVQNFSSKPPGQHLEVMLYQVEQVFSIQHAIKVEPGQQWPSWLEGPMAPSRLTRIVKAFDLLSESKNWPLLQNQIDICYQTFFNEILPAFLESLYLNARKYAQDSNFAMANLTAEAAIKLLRHEIRPYLQLSFTEDNLHQLKDTLAIREQAEVTLWSAAVRLTDPEIQFNDIVSNISVLILNHPDVPIEDLNTLLSDLYQGEKVESLYKQITNLENFTENINRCQSIEDVSFNIIEELPEFLKQADFKLATKLQSRFQSLAYSINHATDKIALTLIERIEDGLAIDLYIDEPNLILRYYWQAYWCLLSGVVTGKSLVNRLGEVLERTESTLDTLLTRTAAKFVNIENIFDLNNSLVLLESLRILNQGMVHNSTHNQIKLQQLPPLPVGIELPEKCIKFDVSLLEIWVGIIKLWVDLANETQTLQRESNDELDKKQDIVNQVLEIQRDYGVIKNEIWPKLNLKDWQENTQLGILGLSISQLHNLINILIDSEIKQEKLSPIDMLVCLDEYIIVPGLLEKIEKNPSWLLEGSIWQITKNVNEQLQKTRKGVEQQISDLMKEKTGLVSAFQGEILTKPKNLVTSSFLFDTIVSNVNRIVNVYKQSDEISEAASLWDSIRLATSPWKNKSWINKTNLELPSDIEKKWQKLHQLSIWEKTKLSVSRRKREIILSAATVCMIIILWVSITTIANSRQTKISKEAFDLITTNTPEPESTTSYLANQTTLIGTETAIKISIQETSTAEKNLRMTATAQSSKQQTATKQIIESISGTSTAQALADKSTATAIHEIFLTEAANTTIKLSPCLDVGNFQYELSSQAKLDPPEGSTYISGTIPIQPVATWEVTNIGSCAWEEILIKPLSENRQADYALKVNDQPITILSDQPLGMNETLTLALFFNLPDAVSVREEWILIINGIELNESPHLIIDIDNWITVITPPSSRP